LSTAALSPGVPVPAAPRLLNLGRPFVNAPFDYLVIGGGLSLLVTAALRWSSRDVSQALLAAALPVVLLMANSAHFAASTVRLYAKRGAFADFRFLTMGLPLVTVAVVTLAVALPGVVGTHLQALYLTWSPYHYGAQAYGLSLMYWYRSGTAPTLSLKRLLRFGCVAPFLYAFMTGPSTGLHWLVPAGVLDRPGVAWGVFVLGQALWVASFVALPLLFVLSWRGSRMPLISGLIVFSNGIWLLVLTFMQAFLWATIFHGLQYLAIAAIFHVKERAHEEPTRGWAYHAAAFYLMCFPLAYLLFQVWPYVYVWAGFGLAESMILVTAVINVHHFIVDAYIWRLRRPDTRAIVTSEAATAA
jgi:hypothetical protein